MHDIFQIISAFYADRLTYSIHTCPPTQKLEEKNNYVFKMIMEQIPVFYAHVTAPHLVKNSTILFFEPCPRALYIMILADRVRV